MKDTNSRPDRRRLPLIFLLVAMPFASKISVAQDIPIPAPPMIGAKSYYVVAGRTGQELASLEPDKKLAPASLTKLMTAYVIFKALAEGQIALDDQVTVSEKAWRTPGSRMFIEVGTRVEVNDLIMGVIVQSGNDASVALAEHVAGTEAVFAEVMNRYASALGMTSSHFTNATGLPGDDHYSTA
ncbi:MAG TPA: serine hydrolase, partial [Woeseiaceae bacterium]|nr:serine hydrolase [Woeseiaceae bacterium]